MRQDVEFGDPANSEKRREPCAARRLVRVAFLLVRFLWRRKENEHLIYLFKLYDYVPSELYRRNYALFSHRDFNAGALKICSLNGDRYKSLC